MIRNFTPDDVTVLIHDDDGMMIFPSEGVARCVTSSEQCGAVTARSMWFPTKRIVIPIYHNVFGVVEGLPMPNGEDLFIVSSPVLSALAGKRDDLVEPDTSPAGNSLRNTEGQVIAVRRFRKI